MTRLNVAAKKKPKQNKKQSKQVGTKKKKKKKNCTLKNSKVQSLENKAQDLYPVICFFSQQHKSAVEKFIQIHFMRCNFHLQHSAKTNSSDLPNLWGNHLLFFRSPSPLFLLFKNRIEIRGKKHKICKIK